MQDDINNYAEPLLEENLWRSGWIIYKLKRCQEDMFRAIELSNRFKYFIKCARRLGKSYLLCLIAIMRCIKYPGSTVRYAAPTAKALRQIIHPIMEKILRDCPDDLRPTWNQMDGCYRFPGGSSMYLAGVNSGHADDLRGTACDLFIVDEAGEVDNLHYLVHDVALPQFLDPDGTVVKGRRLIVASSPAVTPAHEFTEMAREAELDGNYSHYDIFDGEYPLDVIRLFLKEDGIPDADIDALIEGNYSAIKSTTVKREYLAMDVVDESRALIPEWKDDYCQESERSEYFPFYFKYESLDIGVRDLTVCVFAYYDFLRCKLYIEDEITLSGPEMNTERLAERIKSKQAEVFKEHAIKKRISDIDLLLINDLRQLHGLPFQATDKGELEEMLNELRIWVGAGRIIVHPRCEQVLGCMRYGVWNESRTQFDRTKKFGHFDALAAMIYLVRNVDRKTNPIPENYGLSKDSTWFNEDMGRLTKQKQIKQAFSYKR